MDWEDASKLCDEICEAVDTLADEGVVDKAPDFFESVRETLTSIQEDIDEKSRVTPGQIRAITNIQDGVNRWVH